ncbi:sterol desaturase family protein [Kordiimonas aquimaris]|uniref:sterol desaturase family protein n=1 Tax=Kordiimonas aquimaris TaxID=707591 RepID=UPI00374D200C
MEFMNTLIDETQLYAWEVELGDWFYIVSFAFLGFELLRLAVKKMLSWNMIGDTVSNFLTQVGFIIIAFAIFGVGIGLQFYMFEYWSITQLPINGWTIVAGIIFADFIYYWEHRFEHRNSLGWSTHAVHHSSPYFNISVAYRFGPIDSLFPIAFFLPMVVLGFHPAVVLFGEAFVLLYQTFLHTETIGKLSRPIEAVFNTPAHHRVHHGSNPQYLDKNYGGMLIIWDRMFGTFEEEKEKVVYGLTEQIMSVNPFKVFFCGFIWLAKRIARTPGFTNKMKALVMPPDWEPTCK